LEANACAGMPYIAMLFTVVLDSLTLCTCGIEQALHKYQVEPVPKFMADLNDSNVITPIKSSS
jgi:hypothetical protein